MKSIPRPTATPFFKGDYSPESFSSFCKGGAEERGGGFNYNTMTPLIIADKAFGSRLFMGTGKFSSNHEMQRAVEASGSELVTVA